MPRCFCKSLAKTTYVANTRSHPPPRSFNPRDETIVVQKNSQEQLEKKTLALEDTQELRRTEQRSYDRKLTSLTADYERKMNGLINHTGMSGLLHAAIERSEITTGGGDKTAAAPPAVGEGSAGAPPSAERSSSGLEPGRRAGGGARAGTGAGAGGGGDTTQDAMAKVLHERWLSEREKAKALESRLKDYEARIGDLEEVSERERSREGSRERSKQAA